MSGQEGTGDDDEVIIHVPAEMQAGVWANWAVVSESDHAFRESPHFNGPEGGPAG